MIPRPAECGWRRFRAASRFWTLIAAGFLGAQAYVTDAFGVEMTPRTNVSTKIGHYSTSVDKVFTAGDMHRGQSLVVWAIREGREAAKEVDQYLMGYTNLN